MKKIQNFQDFVYSLCQYWMNQGCIWSQPYDLPMGAGTFHPHTFFKALGPEPWRSVYAQPCRRPVDGRYGKSPNRLQYYYQLQVFLKPAPANILDIYLKSLEHINISLKQNDIALYEDNWKGPTLGAWGLGWEVRANGEEVTQFTYFQEFAGLGVEVAPSEITYGLERLYMYANNVSNVMDIPFNNNFTYGDIYFQNEEQFSEFNFKYADTKMLFTQFEQCEQKVAELCEKKLMLPAYDYVLQASHAFNLLDARGALSVLERQRFLGRVRDCAKKCAIVYCADRKEKDYPLLNKIKPEKEIVNLKSHLSHYEAKDHKAPSTSKAKSTPHAKQKPVNILLEVGVEEMPPDFQRSALKALQIKIHSGTTLYAQKYAYNLDFLKSLATMKINVSISTRRIVFQCSHVPQHTPPQLIELWGPAESIAKDSNGHLTQAGLGFCKKNQIDEKKVAFKQKPNTTTNFLYAEKVIETSDFPTILINEVKKYLYTLDMPSKMHWQANSVDSHAFVRPVRWVACLIENEIFPIEMFGVQSSAFTYGQRVLKPSAIKLLNSKDYDKKMKLGEVVFAHDDRKKIILKQFDSLVEKLGNGNVEWIEDTELLEKCVGLTESPYVFLGQFDEKYLKLPAKLISSVLKEHMNYFSLRHSKTKIVLPYYLGVASYKCLNSQSMIAGTQKVVSSRLEDGAFYFENDLIVPIQTLREQLKNQVLQEGLGSLFDKSERLAIFIQDIAQLVNQKKHGLFLNNDIDCLIEAAKNCKNDLKTGCVQEFPDEMQGVMGGFLIRTQDAFHNSEKSAHIAQAVEEHYFPINAHAPLPATPLAFMLALADKFDSLVLLLSAGNEPKGNQDPFGLRRLAIAIARLMNLKNEQNVFEFPCSFEELLEIWQKHFGQFGKANENASGSSHESDNRNRDRNTIGINNFFAERVKSMLKESFNTNSVEAIAKLILKMPLQNCYGLLQSLEKSLLNSTSLIPYKRARSMTQDVKENTIHPNLFTAEVEKTLYSAIQTAQKNTNRYFAKGEFDLFFEELSSLAQPLSEFFDSVLVNDPDLDVRKNRLQLLLKIRNLYENTVDLSVVQVASNHEKL